MRKRRPAATNGEARDEDTILRAWIKDVRETMLGPAQAIYAYLAADGRPPEEAMRAMARKAGIRAAAAMPILGWGPVLREAAEILEAILTDEEEPMSGPLAEDMRALLDDTVETIEALAVLEGSSVAKGAEAEAEQALFEREVSATMANLGCSREEAEAILGSSDRAAAFEAAQAARGEE